MGNQKKPPFHKGLFFTALTSYLIVLLIPVLTGILIYLRTEETISREINRANKALLTQVQQEMDNYVRNIYRISLEIAFNAKLPDFLNRYADIPDSQRYKLVQLIQDFTLYAALSDSVDAFYVYVLSGNYVISNHVYAKAPLFHQMHDFSKDMGYDEWFARLNESHSGEFVRQENGKTVYIQSLPMNSDRSPAGNLVILVNHDKLQELLEGTRWTERGNTYILNSSNETISSSGSAPFRYDVLYEDLLQEQDTLIKEMDGTRVVLSYITSEHTDWKYISVLPYELFMEKAAYVRNLTIGGLLVCFILGIWMAWYFARRNVRPVREIVNLLRNKGEPITGEADNEFHFIRENLSATLEQFQDIRHRLENQKSALRSNFLARVLKGQLESDLPVEDTLASYDVHFPTDRFAVLLIYIEDYHGLFREDLKGDETERLFFVRHILTNIIEELVGVHYIGVMVEVDDMLACLVNSKTGELDPDDLQAIAEEAHRFIAEKFFIHFTGAISRVHEKISGIAAAYQEAVETMEYRIVIGSNRIHRQENTRNHGGEPKKYMYSIQVEQRFINTIKSGEIDEARQVLSTLFKQSREEVNLSVSMAKCLMFDMVGTMIKTLDELDLEQGRSNLPFDDAQMISGLMQSETMQQMEEKMLELLEFVCTHIDAKKQSRNVQLKDEVEQFILTHYSDSNLSISSIAEHFDMNPAYLSRFFKEQSGEGMVDFIHLTRIKEGKKCMENEGLTIAETAEKIGFVNSNSFIRTFKKYEGITPGKYKSIFHIKHEGGTKK
ncbi:helix-turn-helix domain-containing protein [Paenibacillus sp. IB182496]|uniref:Helix-turn-helix domain-containing protein n=1 Tax=Paenibacillus sabuli TaxID=2772509 RepID=A0A927GQB0_9BACL|nr:cache domain-containing protein [Paenibacillus sabuli]MBD2843572.1 helix-turn-helix domain-containing protein [Paenibacillus sabuli]